MIRTSLLGFVASLGLCCASLSAATLARGPYLQNVTPTSLTIRWRTSEPTDSQVRFGPVPGLLTVTNQESVLATEHEMRLTGLMPDTTCYYAVGTSLETLAEGAECRFTTAPSASRPVRIWVTGDTRMTIDYGTNDSRGLVRDAYLAMSGDRPADLAMQTGDLADMGLDQELQEAFFDVYAAPMRRTPVYACAGNHDLGTAKAQAFLDAFSFPAEGQAGGVPSGSERYYSFDYANIHFVVLDSYGPDVMELGSMDPAYQEAELQWLTNDLTAASQPWIIAMFHSPPYSHGSHNSDWEWDSVNARAGFVPVLESFGVDLVLNGHSHNYERSCLLRGHFGPSWTLTEAMKLNGGNGRPDGDGPYYKPDRFAGTVYAVVGCSGFLGSGTLDHPAMAYSANANGSLLVDINGGVLQARFLRETGAIDDRFVIIQGTQPPAVRITSIKTEAGQVRLSWDAVEGLRYQVYRRPSLTASREKAGGEVLAGNIQADWSEPLDPATSMAFYEVESLSPPSLRQAR